MTKLTFEQKKKLTKEVSLLLMALVGVIILICNFFKIVPDNDIITAIIAYGFLIGPAMIVLGIGTFFEIREN